ncbi:hypothetical protein [Winogradskya humida]|uniref:Uncharacterized protein n=1 Tax=Winogradskya humida TaxID=113566 RepID=A0ABQ4A7S2_9ACTN|nr:hypothetical protein [Actinoplanes humidus]GIE26678.1 hypothetical protein Ahu01nite_097800 [Actinoplanes humidus]
MTKTFKELACPLPDCGEPMFLRMELGASLYDDDLGPIASTEANVSEWSVQCIGGHVLLVPAPVAVCCDGDDCTCDVDHADEFRTFRRSDGERLQATLMQLGSAAAR